MQGCGNSEPSARHFDLFSSDVRYVSIYRNIDIFVQYRDTILAFKCIDTLEWTV